MEIYELDPSHDIQVDYWSNQIQTYQTCSYLNPWTTDGEHFISEDDLCVSNEGKPCLVLRFKNCTGNIIDLDDKKHPKVTPTELAKARMALSID